MLYKTSRGINPGNFIYKHIWYHFGSFRLLSLVTR
nr:MAG TPA: hypothetical protein [Caudoviricetes sp.]